MQFWLKQAPALTQDACGVAHASREAAERLLSGVVVPPASAQRLAMAAPRTPPATYRRTLQPLDPEAFIIPQFWASESGVWWDLRYLHVFCMKTGGHTRKRNHWLARRFHRKVLEAGCPHNKPPAGVNPLTADTVAIVGVPLVKCRCCARHET